MFAAAAISRDSTNRGSAAADTLLFTGRIKTIRRAGPGRAGPFIVPAKAVRCRSSDRPPGLNFSEIFFAGNGEGTHDRAEFPARAGEGADDPAGIGPQEPRPAIPLPLCAQKNTRRALCTFSVRILPQNNTLCRTISTGGGGFVCIRGTKTQYGAFLCL